MIPLHLVTGFLGSGKTSFLLDVAARFKDRKLVFLVNEFSRHTVDPEQLAFTGMPVVAVRGGSIFCRCLVTEFLGLLGELPGRFSFSSGGPEAVVIEASGIADPRSVESMLRESRLDRVYRLASVTGLADPGSFVKLVAVLPNIRAQVLASDVVFVNKTDLYGESEVRATEEAIRRVKPNLRIVRTQHGRTDWSPFAGEHAGGLAGNYGACRDPHFACAAFRLPEMTDLDQLRAAVAQWEDRVYRIKGRARIHEKVHTVDYSPGGWNIREAAGESGDHRLVFIFHPSLEGELSRLGQRLRWEAEEKI